MEPLASPIHIPISSSRSISRLIIFGHLVVIVLLTIELDPGANLAIGITALTLSCYIQQHFALHLRRRVAAILLRTDGRWNVVSPDGAIVDVVSTKCLFVSPHLVVLRLLPVAQTAVHIVLTDDNTPVVAFRRLRVRLRFPI